MSFELRLFPWEAPLLRVQSASPGLSLSFRLLFTWRHFETQKPQANTHGLTQISTIVSKRRNSAENPKLCLWAQGTSSRYGGRRPAPPRRDGTRPCGTCAPRSAARREREGKGRAGRREGRQARVPRPGAARRGGGRAVPGAAPHGSARSRRRGGAGQRREGTGSASPRRWAASGRGVPAPGPGRALPKRRKKKKAVIKVAAAARGPTLPTGRLPWQTGGDSRAALPRSRAATSAATSHSLPRPPWQHRRRRLPPSRPAPRTMDPATPRLVLGLLVSEGGSERDHRDEWVGAGAEGSAAERTWPRLSSALFLLHRGCSAHRGGIRAVISAWLLTPKSGFSSAGPLRGA